MSESDKEPRTYGFEYPYKGARYLLNIPAASESEARDRIQKCGVYGLCVGTLEATIPAVAGAGILTRLICWWRNL